MEQYNTNVSYHPHLWSALGHVLAVAMVAAEGAEGHSLHDCTDWLNEIGEALHHMNGMAGPYRVTVEDLPEDALEFDSEHVLTNTGGGYGVNGKSLQAICAAGRVTIVPVRPDQCPELYMDVLVGGDDAVTIEARGAHVTFTDEQREVVDCHSTLMVLDTIADRLDERMNRRN